MPHLLALKPVAPAGELAPRPWRHSLNAVAIGSAAWAAPMIAVFALLGPDHVLWQVGVFFSKLAVVTFGGAYAVLAYMAQQAVQGFGWLSPGEMADGLGLAETTPGPLIMVTQFVGYLAAFRDPAPVHAHHRRPAGRGADHLGDVRPPCFLWIFAFAPWIERLEHAPRLKGALAAVTASIVGVIANLSVWFALHVLFTRVAPATVGPVQIALPNLTSLDWRAALIAGVAAWLVIGRKWNVMAVLALAAGAGLVLCQAFPA
ncbi:chromate transporter [Novosphingobium colocasiae]